ncbi:MAG: error-prone DNA polymerase [Xanthomonadales bacterium]|nr:error-prone DNA polymerase [Xanthomonadales bacterium]
MRRIRPGRRRSGGSAAGCGSASRSRPWLGAELHRQADDARWQEALRSLAKALGLRIVACGDVHMHRRGRRALQDALTAIRLRGTLADLAGRLFPNGERHLRSREELAALYPREWLAESVEIAGRCQLSLRELRYRYPHELVPPGLDADQHLAQLAWLGAVKRWPGGIPEKVKAQLERELALIAELGYAHFFLTVHDLVRFARDRGILCQGRGSAANSAVCYCLGITEVDPARVELLFERFLSRERREPPDIDVDFEHERREEVIQYALAKYGRERAALAATVIRYRPRSAVRDLARALGFAPEEVARMGRALAWSHDPEEIAPRLREAGYDPGSPPLRRLIALARELVGHPRHLSQHVGGLVISEEPLSHLVPVEPAAMPGRQVIQWDKDDLETLGLLKVDCLALGMLSCLRRALDLLGERLGQAFGLADIPPEDPGVYEMLSRGDSVGVFQVESRAQQAMLPRLRPRNFYDLVIEVAIVRPGPIQGQMVHPYLRRRNGEEPVSYPSEAVRAVLERTLGVPIFQEQVMRLAMVAAGFTPGEADRLRRAMGAWRRRGELEVFRERLLQGMQERGYAPEFAERLFEQIRGFGSYGFPESHAASFALLVYASAWIKRYHPEVFACALLNSQPLGFYAPDQILTDARRHGVRVLPVDVRVSGWDSALEPLPPGQCRESPPRPALRLGLREVKGLARAAAERILAARAAAPFRDLADFAARSALDAGSLERLAAAGALFGLAGHRRRALWEVGGLWREAPLFAALPPPGQGEAAIRPASGWENACADYATLGHTLGPHPLVFLRPELRARGFLRLAEAAARAGGERLRVAGLVRLRQRPGTAKGTLFLTLEDESASLNVIVWPAILARQRWAALASPLLGVVGRLEARDGVAHLLAERLLPLDGLLGGLPVSSRDFH